MSEATFPNGFTEKNLTGKVRLRRSFLGAYVLQVQVFGEVARESHPHDALNGTEYIDWWGWRDLKEADLNQIIIPSRFEKAPE